VLGGRQRCGAKIRAWTRCGLGLVLVRGLWASVSEEAGILVVIKVYIIILKMKSNSRFVLNQKKNELNISDIYIFVE